MLRKVRVPVPKYLKKFLEYEFDARDGVIQVERWSELGNLIHYGSRYYPFPLAVDRPSGVVVTIAFYSREKSFELTPDKLPDLARQLDEIFRRSLICEVRRVHELAGGNYGDHVRAFLDRYKILGDVDVDYETMRKVYRDYLARTERKNHPKAEKVLRRKSGFDTESPVSTQKVRL